MLSLRMATQLRIKCNVLFQDPGRIWPGKRMAGHMGNKNCTKFAVRVRVSIFTDSIPMQTQLRPNRVLKRRLQYLNTVFSSVVRRRKTVQQKSGA